ncbi:MAG TPA: DSD1 family PLP-dependent enzyme [Acetobacteraceae bacterium]|nr:DSD1 family PLP-dependent enzyme [Acetobacteraceae bacterium]
MELADVETPALLVDRALLDGNIAILAAYLQRHAPGLRLRPHAKTHKSPDLARRQVAAGAVGVCCQTVGEVEAMAAAGIADVLLSNQVADAGKAARLAMLAGSARIGACVDHPLQVALLEEAAQEAGTRLHVLVEVDVGGGRCGVATPETAAALAGMVAESPGLVFAGLQAYHGRAQHLRGFDERQAAIEEASRRAEAAAERIRARGLACDTITGAGTGSFAFEAGSGVYTELQCGSYVFMDADYALNQPDPQRAVPGFAHALTLLTTVISTPVPGRLVCDAGLKSMSLDSGPPSLALHPGLAYAGPSDEHSTLDAPPDCTLQPGDRLQLIPGHCDPTVAMHDWLVVHADGVVTELWPVARGW